MPCKGVSIAAACVFVLADAGLVPAVLALPANGGAGAAGAPYPPQEVRITAPAEPAFSPDQLAHYQSAITRAELRRGPYAPALIEPLQDLGRQPQETGRHREALGQYRRALHLVRINGGLYEPRQIPLLEQVADSQSALGLLQQADRTRDYLYRVQRQAYAPGSDSASNAALAHARWKREAYLAGAGGERYLQLLAIHRTHERSLAEIVSRDENDVAQVPHLYGSLRSEYLISRYEGEGIQRGLSISTPGYGGTGSQSLEAEEFRLLRKYNFRNGRRTLLRLIDVIERQPQPDVAALARARIALGDWYMWWREYARALDSYEEAWRLWAADNNPETDPGSLFEEPVVLPDRGLVSGISSEDDEGPATVTVRFRVSRLGEAQGIEVQQVQAPSEREAGIARVVMHNRLRHLRFRPVVRDGEVVAAAPVERTYRVNY